MTSHGYIGLPLGRVHPRLLTGLRGKCLVEDRLVENFPGQRVPKTISPDERMPVLRSLPAVNHPTFALGEEPDAATGCEGQCEPAVGVNQRLVLLQCRLVLLQCICAPVRGHTRACRVSMPTALQLHVGATYSSMRLFLPTPTHSEVYDSKGESICRSLRKAVV